MYGSDLTSGTQQTPNVVEAERRAVPLEREVRALTQPYSETIDAIEEVPSQSKAPR
jgi:hypothetical protein